LKLYTIGFTKKSASGFFELLRGSGATRVVDIRLRNMSQLAGFTKRGDLGYFLREICRMEYIHLSELAPTPELLDSYRKGGMEWHTYEVHFKALLEERRIENMGLERTIANACLLCSEDKPDQCHRRLVAEYLQRSWGDLEIVHL